jgi:hypothetical protein
MEDDYWGASSVKKKVNQQGIFDTDDNNSVNVSFTSRTLSDYIFLDYHQTNLIKHHIAL